MTIQKPADGRKPPLRKTCLCRVATCGRPRGKAKIYDFALYLRAVAAALLKAKAS